MRTDELTASGATPYPKHGTQAEKQAWAKVDTARRTNAADTGWHGEDTSVQLVEYTVDNKRGEVINLRFVPRHGLMPATLAPEATHHHQARTTTRMK